MSGFYFIYPEQLVSTRTETYDAYFVAY